MEARPLSTAPALYLRVVFERVSDDEDLPVLHTISVGNGAFRFIDKKNDHTKFVMRSSDHGSP